jgi:hypothetical protein
MSILWALGIGLCYALFSCGLILLVRPRVPAQRTDAIARMVGLPLSPEVEPNIRTTQRGEVRAVLVTIVVALAAATVGILLSGISAPGQIFWIDFTATIAALGLGMTISTVRHERGRQAGSVRVARLRAVSLSDYRSPYEQWMPRIVVALALAGLVLRGAVDPHGFAIVPVFVWVYAGITIATLLVCEIGGRAIIRGGQPAGSELELAWDDALKSRALAAIAIAPLYLGAYFGIGTVAFFPQTHTGPTADAAQLEIGVSLVAMILVLVWLVITLVTKPQQRYLRRLWPEFAARAAALVAVAAEVGRP